MKPEANIPDGQHIWRQTGMTGSDRDECALCGAKSSGMGQEADAAAGQPCRYRIELRTYSTGTQLYRVAR